MTGIVLLTKVYRLGINWIERIVITDYREATRVFIRNLNSSATFLKEIQKENMRECLD